MDHSLCEDCLTILAVWRLFLPLGVVGAILVYWRRWMILPVGLALYWTVISTLGFLVAGSAAGVEPGLNAHAIAASVLAAVLPLLALVWPRRRRPSRPAG